MMYVPPEGTFRRWLAEKTGWVFIVTVLSFGLLGVLGSYTQLVSLYAAAFSILGLGGMVNFGIFIVNKPPPPYHLTHTPGLLLEHGVIGAMLSIVSIPLAAFSIYWVISHQ